MKDQSRPKAFALPLKSHLIKKFDWIPSQNLTPNRKKPKAETPPSICRDLKEQDFISVGRVPKRGDPLSLNFRELKSSVNKKPVVNWPFAQGNIGEGTSWMKSIPPQKKDLFKLPMINSPAITKVKKTMPKSMKNSTTFKIDDDEKENSFQALIYRRIEPAHLKRELQRHQISKSALKNNERKNEISINSQIRPRTVQRKREPIKIYIQDQAKEGEMAVIMETDLSQSARKDIKAENEFQITVTSAYHSNPSLSLDKYSEEDSEGLIREVVEKHVEEAWRTIKLIKKNFATKDKTYLFQVEKN